MMPELLARVLDAAEVVRSARAAGVFDLAYRRAYSDVLHLTRIGHNAPCYHLPDGSRTVTQFEAVDAWVHHVGPQR